MLVRCLIRDIIAVIIIIIVVIIIIIIIVRGTARFNAVDDQSHRAVPRVHELGRQPQIGGANLGVPGGSQISWGLAAVAAPSRDRMSISTAAAVVVIVGSSDHGDTHGGFQ